MEMKLYLRMLQRGWWIIVLTMLVALIIALLMAYIVTPVYRATARFAVSPNASLAASSRDVVTSLEALDKRSIILTYAEFLNSNRIYEETLQALHLDPTQMLDYTHTTTALPDANILELSVEGTDPQLAASLANTLGQNAVQQIKDLYQVYDINLLDPATVPLIPIRPQPLRDAGLAAALGFILGAALAILREQIRIPLDAYRQRVSLDPVSLVFNRRHFMRQVEEEIAANPNDPLSLGLLELPTLQDLIESMPEALIQSLLRQVAGILRNELRGNDIIGRWNNSTFALLLPATPQSAADRTMERIRRTLSKPLVLDEYGERVELQPYTSTSTYQKDDTAVGLAERAERDLQLSGRGEDTTANG